MDKVVLILGFGVTGQAAKQYLEKKNVEVIVFDDYKNLNPFSENFDYSRIDFVLKSPGIKPGHKILKLLSDKGIRILSELDVFLMYDNSKNIIGITGTNGKSTVTHFVYEILKREGKNVVIGGNFGYPILGLEMSDYYVLELSSYQLFDTVTDCEFIVSCITNIEQDHLQYHGNMDNYANAKSKIFKNSKLKILGAQNQFTDNIEKQYKDLVLCCGGNHAIVTCICSALGISSAKIKQHLSDIPGLEHRMELVSNNGKLCIINDSKSTNLHSTIYALNHLNSNVNIILILGGRTKGEDFSVLEQYSDRIKKIYLIGESIEKFSNEIKKIPLEITYDIETTIDKINIATSEILLFSPGCASFDQFENFEHRGKEFKRLIHEKYH